MTGEAVALNDVDVAIPASLERSGGKVVAGVAVFALAIGGLAAYAEGWRPGSSGDGRGPEIFVAGGGVAAGESGKDATPTPSPSQEPKPHASVAPPSPHAPRVTHKPAPSTHPAPKPEPKPKPKPVVCHDYSVGHWGINPNATHHTGGGTQLISVVAAHRTDHIAKLAVWEKHGKCWTPAVIGGKALRGPLRAQIGRNGMVPFAKRRPGSATTPTGLFSIGTTIYGNDRHNPNKAYRYHRLQRGDWWVEAPSAGRAYDTFRHENPNTTPWYGSQSEALWTVGQAYDTFIDINMPTPPNNAAGIFLHHYSELGATAGCIALRDSKINLVLKALRPKAHPHMLIKVQ
jgi:L,D-peptidoglycan transpeptidase YkuD (ErfK/YbiS/YcfS/YnhG family)